MISGDLEKKIKKNSEVVSCYTPPIPKNMLLEVTNICNHKCIFCANEKSTRTRGLLDVSLGKKIMQDAYDAGVREIGFYATGEPLVHPQLSTFIKCAKKIGYTYIYITTNGALLDEIKAKEIIEAGIDSVKFSINASNQEDYFLIHGKDDFYKVVNNIKNFNVLRKKYNRDIKLYASFIVTKYTHDKKEELKNIIDECVDDILFVDCANQGGYMHEINGTLTVNDKLEFLNGLNWCPIIFNNLYISYEGYLTMCCTDFQNYLAVADLREENIELAWVNEKAQKLRKAHMEHKLDGILCYNCIYNCENDIEALSKKYSVEFKYKELNQKDKINQRLKAWEEGIK